VQKITHYSGTGTLTSGSTVTVSGISNMDSIWVVIDKASNTAGNTQVNLRINSDTGNNYAQAYLSFTRQPVTQCRVFIVII